MTDPPVFWRDRVGGESRAGSPRFTGVTATVAAAEPARLRLARSALGRSSRKIRQLVLSGKPCTQVGEDCVLERSLAGSAAATERFERHNWSGPPLFHKAP